MLTSAGQFFSRLHSFSSFSFATTTDGEMGAISQPHAGHAGASRRHLLRRGKKKMRARISSPD